MIQPHHVAHWYPTAAYLYILWLDALALAWEYLRRHPDYRLDWLRHHRRPQAAQQAAHRWGLRLLEDPALDARDAHPAWLPGHAAVVVHRDLDQVFNADAEDVGRPVHGVVGVGVDKAVELRPAGQAGPLDGRVAGVAGRQDRKSVV